MMETTSGTGASTATQTLCPMCRGREAFKSGEPIEANPYDFMTYPNAWSQWRLGHNAEKEVA